MSRRLSTIRTIVISLAVLVGLGLPSSAHADQVTPNPVDIHGLLVAKK